MGRAPCCAKVGLHRGPWTAREDTLLTKYIQVHGEGLWRSLPKKAGLLRCGKSCRLRWMNYLRPDIKRGNITSDEEDLIIRLHTLLGNRWSLIAGRLPGRTDNEVKNYWNTHLSKRLKSQGIDPNTHRAISESAREPKKKKNNKKKKSRDNIGEATQTKIHLPKPIRVTSLSIIRNNSFDWSTVSGASSHGGDHKLVDTKNLDHPCCNNFKDGDDHDGGALVDDEDHDLVNGCDLSCQSHIPTKANMLEKLYEEYLQLLEREEDEVQLDSFAESLWA